MYMNYMHLRNDILKLPQLELFGSEPTKYICYEQKQRVNNTVLARHFQNSDILVLWLGFHFQFFSSGCSSLLQLTCSHFWDINSNYYYHHHRYSQLYDAYYNKLHQNSLLFATCSFTIGNVDNRWSSLSGNVFG